MCETLAPTKIAATESEIRKIHEAAQEWMGLDKWHATLVFDTECEDMANTEAHFGLMLYTITFNPLTCHAFNSLEELVMHELGHVIIDPISKMVEDLIHDLPKACRRPMKKMWLRLEDQIATHIARMPALRAALARG